jgi:uncharacterized membrane protein
MDGHPSDTYTETEETTQLYGRIERILAFGFWTAIGIIILGVLLAFVTGEDVHEETLHIQDVFPAVIQGDPDGIIDLGILLLLLTPFSYVVAALLLFISRRDRLFVAVCLALILLIFASIGLALA